MLRRLARFLPHALAISLVCFASHAQAQSLTVTAPSSFTIHPGDQNVPLPVTLGASSLTGPVSITLRGLPSGITVTPLVLAPGASGNLLLDASVFADRENFPATSIGRPNSATRTVTVVAAAGTTQATANTAFTVSLSNPAFAPAPDKIDLPIVRIDTGGTPVISKDIDVPGTITITSADGATTYLPNSSDTDNTATFHVHGTTTAAMQKKPYSIKLHTSLDLLSTMGLYCPYNKDPSQSTCDKSKSYILLANYDDKSLLRNWAAYALANAIPMGGDYLSSPAGSPSPSKTALMPWAPHSLFVELYLNGQYLGNYELIEKVNVDSHRVNITELSESDTGAGGDDITGGYFMEIDQHQDESFVFVTPLLLPIGLIDPDFSPDPEVPQQTAYISNYVKQAENALVYGDPTDPVTGWRAYFDEATLVNFYLVNEIMGNSDGGAFFSSDYLYKQQGNPLLYMGPVWDFDISAGNVNYQPVANPTATWMRTRSPWYLHLFTDPSFQADVAAQFNALKKNGVFDSWLNSINQQAAALQKSQANNFARWPILGITVWPNTEATGSYTGEVGFLTTYLKLRIAWLDSILNSNKASTTTILRLSAGSARAGSPVDLSAAVTGGNSPTGTVTFLLNGLPGPSVSLDGTGKGGVSISDLPAGIYNITAVYNGDGQNALSSSDPATLTIGQPLIATTTTIASSSSSIRTGDSVKITAAVIPTSGTAIPTGSLVFTANGSPLGSASLATDGTATLETTGLPAGNISIQAVYSGDSSYSTSSSPSTTVAVVPLGNFALSASPQSGSQPNIVFVTLTITQQQGFNRPVTLQCASGLPAGAICTFAPDILTPASAPVTSLLRISTPVQTANMMGPHGMNLRWEKLAGALTLALLIWPAARRRRWPFAALFLAIAGLAISGCGSNHSQQGKAYSVTVTATSGTLTQSTVLHITLDN